ncbi:MAG: hypothetical protein U9Q82_12000 [Chloroflexota bacterium]|nr:hypothetical protein [Chloroflexota bacterium]
MKNWTLGTEDAGAYTIAADARCRPTDYANDHIWELSLDGGDHASLSLQTTFGLRTLNLRLFPRFVEGDAAISNPGNFSAPPTVHRFYPNYLKLAFSPFTGIDVQIEYWVPESHAIAGRVSIQNNRLAERKLRFEWAAVLSVAAEGERMKPKEIEAVTILCGKTNGLTPVVFMTGGPHFSPGPYPALATDIELLAGSERIFTWVAAALDQHDASFNLAREIAARPWEEEIAHLDVLNDGLINIESGNSEWDAAFALSQKNAFGLFVGPTDQLPHPSFVFSRQPDQGYSQCGDGSDYTHLWDGQPPFEANFLLDFILPAAPELARGLLENFLSTQKKSGFVDWKPGLGGHRSGLMATPILTHLAWKIYQVNEDKDFLQNVYPKLLNAVQNWFTPQQDRDGDGLPEWAHLMQSGLDAHSTFSQWQPWAQGADISQSESPALCALLYREIQILIQMAQILEQTGPIPSLQALAENLKSALDACWDDDISMYRYWDRETHFSPPGDMLGSRQGPGEIYLQREFDQPVRLLVSIEAAEKTPRQVIVFLRGTSASGRDRIERIPENQFQWRMQRGNVTTQCVYTSLEYIEIQNIGPDDEVRVQIVDLACQDYSLFLPLWANVPTQERADAITQNALLNPERFWRPFGIPLCTSMGTEKEDSPCQHISILWETLIGKGLLKYGYRDEAAELVTRLMTAVLAHLKKHKAFAHSYHCETGDGIGEHNALQGLAPLSLFLETLGVRLISPTKVALEGQNPFPWSVTVKYRGLTIIREKKKTKVIFPGGQTTTIKNQKAHIVELDRP